jgi:hypothetical protein
LSAYQAKVVVNEEEIDLRLKLGILVNAFSFILILDQR